MPRVFCYVPTLLAAMLCLLGHNADSLYSATLSLYVPPVRTAFQFRNSDS